MGGGEVAAGRGARRARHFWIIDVAAVLPGLLYVTGYVLAATRSGDYYWSLANGRWMMAHHGVMRHDPFSYTLAKHAIIANEWLYDIWLAKSSEWLGAGGAVAAVAALSTLCAAWYFFTRGARGWVLGTVVGVVGVVLAPLYAQGRAFGVSIGLAALELVVLAAARRRPWWLGVIAPMMVLWINVHPSALLGMVFLVGELVASSQIRGRWGGRFFSEYSSHPRWLALTAVISLLALGVTPWGWSTAWYDVGVVRSGEITNAIQEWRSPDFHSLGWMLILFVGVVVVVWAQRLRGPWLELLLGTLLLAGFVYSVRYVSYLVLIMGALVSWIWATRKTDRERFVGMWSSVVWALALSVGVASVASGTGTRATNDFPLAGLHAARQVKGHVLVEYEWGGVADLEGLPTFIDGRTDLFVTNGVLSQYEAIATLSHDPEKILGHWHIEAVLWSKETALYEYLRSDPAWRVRWSSAHAVLFVRTTPSRE